MLALLATLVGLAMVAGGIYGLVTDDDDDDSSPPSSAAGEPGFPLATDERCAQLAERDERLRTIRDLKLEAPSGRSGRAEVNPICNGTSLVLTFDMEGIEPAYASYYVWLYQDGRNAQNVGAGIPGDKDGGTGFGSATIGPDVETEGYDQIVITGGKFGRTPKRPRPIVFSGRL